MTDHSPVLVLDTVEMTESVDVIVVGSGGSGLTAAVMAAEAGASVLVLEKGDHEGGTTLKSGGGVWVPLNRQAKEAGLEDSAEAALHYMARTGRPELYAADRPNLGLPAWEYELIKVFCYNAGRAFSSLEDLGAVSMMLLEDFPNYYPELPENFGVTHGRSMSPQTMNHGREFDGMPAEGPEMIRQLRSAMEARGGVLRTEHRVVSVVRDGERVVGVVARTPDGDAAIGARRGVIFASGGFTHNATLAQTYLSAPVYGGCAAVTNEGDFVAIAQTLGASMRAMGQSWGCPVVLEHALAKDPAMLSMFVIVGRSILAVNRYGQRVMNEKTIYADACLPMTTWDPIRGEYPNLPLFVIWDEQTQRDFGGKTDFDGGLIPGPDESRRYVATGATLDELAEDLRKRLASIGTAIGQVALADDFVEQLHATVARFNQFASDGVDHDFHRGESAIEQHLHTIAVGNAETAPDEGAKRESVGWTVSGSPEVGATALTTSNDLMAPLANQGPFYAGMIAPGALDTKGGPQTNRYGQVLDHAGNLIPGLYAVGNCAGSPSGRAYSGAGATLGPMMTFAWLAGQHAGGRTVPVSGFE